MKATTIKDFDTSRTAAPADHPSIFGSKNMSFISSKHGPVEREDPAEIQHTASHSQAQPQKQDTSIGKRLVRDIRQDRSESFTDGKEKS